MRDEPKLHLLKMPTALLIDSNRNQYLVFSCVCLAMMSLQRGRQC
jgi:hypothetical protein